MMPSKAKLQILLKGSEYVLHGNFIYVNVCWETALSSQEISQLSFWQFAVSESGKGPDSGKGSDSHNLITN